MARVVTLTTDIGWAYAAQVKGVLLRALGPGRVVDLAHDLPAHGIAEAAFLLRHLGATFPPGTVHLAIVDPGVGGTRAPVAIACRDGSSLVGPDNGLLDPLARHLGVRAVVRLDRSKVRGPGGASATFDGRDLFAPAAARLANGAALRSLGGPATLTPLPVVAPRAGRFGHLGRVQHIDAFGNIITDLPPSAAPPFGALAQVRFGRGRSVTLPVRRVYEEVAPGTPLLLVSSFGLLEIALRTGRAADRFRVRVGDRVLLRSVRPRNG